ncbi:AMP-binding protein [Ectothiorhodospira lacustris]|uniref:AMP-binding protein n=1 Tax=Ectothiorhodospira lacustris TaxID=2899127 RepID=UPI001EE88232|nr:AMP-binding protein [Ectothiorhodospira lacustris]MCG5501379.1 AMP-binding protein [Ectothiorhodospira lacustris]MCG5511241.1 AMP-binding protein [Ectothiorhodospira lacustris]MCG5522943.1 AMP-binding protein [Ectothiorhodospira lacustris]
MSHPDYSYVHGAGAEPLQGTTVGDCLRRQASTRPEDLAVVDCTHDVCLSWRELDAAVDRLAVAFLALGLEPGDRIAIWMMNRSEWTLTQLAAARLGMISVNINPGARKAELQRFLNLVQVRALVTQDVFKTSDYIQMLQELLPELADAENGILSAAAIPSLQRVIRVGEAETPGTLNFSRLMQAECTPQALARVAEMAARVEMDDPVNIQFSNAMGGEPAGTTLTHHNILNNGHMVGQSLCLGADDRVCIPVPLFHCFGMVMGNMACLGHGAAMVYPGEAFDPLDTLKAVAGQRCTALYGVPAMFKAMLDHERFSDFDLASLRTGIMAGAPCPPETMDQVMRLMHMAQVTIGYGMTESSPISFMSDVNDPVERRLNTVGTIRPHVEAKVIDSEGRIVPRGVTGELCVRGYNVMRGYWDDPELSRRVVDAAGWLHTGDLAQIDGAGYCRIVGGVKDMIIRGGENIYPRELEDFLRTHPQIRDAVVVGIPDDRLGEVVCACVELGAGTSLTEAAVKDFCKGQIAHFKIPLHVRLYEAFPRSTGRALKFMLRDEALAALGIHAPPAT